MRKAALFCCAHRLSTAIKGVFSLWLLVTICFAEQRYPLSFVVGTQEGDQVDLINHQIDSRHKVAAIKNFVRTYPKHASVSHFLEWLQIFFLRDNNPDESIDAGEKLLALHADDFDVMLRGQRAAAIKNDPAVMKVWDDRVLAMAERVVVSPQPRDLTEDVWKQSLELAKAMLAEREYKAYVNASDLMGKSGPQPMEDFLTKYPRSKYLMAALQQVMNWHRAVGDGPKTIIAADRYLSNDPTNPDALLLIAQTLMEKKQNHQRVMDIAARVIQIVPNRVAPENMTKAEWEKRKAYYLGSAYLMTGNVYVMQNSYAMADKTLRLALPYLKGGGQTEAAALFYIGWANYYMEHYDDAAVFFRQSIAFGGQFGEQAKQNLAGMIKDRRINE